MIRHLWLTGLLFSSVLSGSGAGTQPARSVPPCIGVTLSASYLASVAPDQGPGFHFTLTNKTGRAIRLAAPVPSSAHWYARSNGRWWWRASHGAGGGLLDAGNEHGRLTVYPGVAASGSELVTVPPYQSTAWTASQRENPVLSYDPSCRQCSYPGERQYQVVFAYAYLAPGLLGCGLRSLPVPMPPKF